MNARAWPAPWTHLNARAWVDRHGGNVAACARRLRVSRSQLGAWLADPAEASSARELPPAVQAHMETLDRYEHGRDYGADPA